MSKKVGWKHINASSTFSSTFFTSSFLYLEFLLPRFLAPPITKFEQGGISSIYTPLDSSFARFEGVNVAALQKHERAFKHHCMGTSTYALAEGL